MKDRIKDIENLMSSWDYNCLEDKTTKRVIVYEVCSHELSLSDILKVSAREVDELYVSTVMRAIPYEDYDEEWMVIEKDLPLDDQEYLEYLEHYLLSPFEIKEWQEYQSLYKRFIGETK